MAKALLGLNFLEIKDEKDQVKVLIDLVIVENIISDSFVEEEPVLIFFKDNYHIMNDWLEQIVTIFTTPLYSSLPRSQKLFISQITEKIFGILKDLCYFEIESSMQVGDSGVFSRASF